MRNHRSGDVMKMHGGAGFCCCGHRRHLHPRRFVPAAVICRFEPGTEGTFRSSKINVRVISVLLCFALLTMFCFGIWVYLEPLAVQAHYPDGVVHRPIRWRSPVSRPDRFWLWC